MSQFRILAENYLFQSDVTVTASSTNTNFPLSNLQKYHRSKVWRSSSTAGTFKISSANNKLDFIEVATELTATITSGTYTATSLAAEIKTQLEAIGANTYTVTYSAQTGLWTISAGGPNVTLPFNSGSHSANSIGPTIGFNSDYGGSTSHTGSEIATHSEETITVDCSVTSPVDSCAIVFDPLSEIPLTQNATIRLQASATDVWTSPTVDVELFIDFDYNSVTHFFTSVQNYRYWRLVVSDPNNPNLCVEIPKLILSSAVQLTQTPEIGFKSVIDDQSVMTKTPYGHEYYDVYPLRRALDFTFAYLSEADVITLERVFREVGNTVPICVCLDPLEESFSDKDRLFLYCRIKGAHTQTHKFYTYFDVGLSVLEAM
jgi:hypothetical protein